MRVKVTKEGVQIPPEMIEDADEVEIRKEGNRLVVVPVLETEREASDHEREDPVFGLGCDPVPCDAPDASDRHDAYLYDA